jgi:hypothetical protein
MRLPCGIPHVDWVIFPQILHNTYNLIDAASRLVYRLYESDLTKTAIFASK